MKHLIILFVLFLGLGTARAQTAEQTIEWLNAKVPPLQRDPDFSSTIRFKDEFCESGNSIETTTKNVVESHVFNYSNIKSVSFIQSEIKNQLCYKIILTGDFKEIRLGHEGKIEGTKKIDRTSFIFNPSVQKEEIARIVKALKHLATIKGAKLLDDNLF